MVLESRDSGTYEILVKDCMGEVTDSFRHRGRMELLSVQVPVAGRIYIWRLT